MDIPFTPWYRQPMDKRLKNAAIQGDVDFLRQAIASQKPLEYFKLKYVPRYGAKEVGGNIFHLAALNGRVEFIGEALKRLPFLVVHDLLTQVNNQWKTPLDEDFLLKHNQIVPLIEDLYERNNSMDSRLKNAAIQGDVEFLKQAVASEKPPEYFKSRSVPCPIGEDENGGNIFHLAAYHERVEFFKAAMEILPLPELDLDILLWQCDNDEDHVLEIAEGDDSRRDIVELIEGIYKRRNTMDEQLKKAAIEGDVEFLNEAIDSDKPVEYFQSLYCVPDPEDRGEVGNIFHLAARNKRGKFLREAMEELSQTGVDVHLLLCQQDHPKWKSNPLHVATGEGYNNIVKVILDYYEKSLPAPANSSPPPSSSTSSAQSTNAMDCHSVKPWLAKDAQGYTPFHWVMLSCREECVLKLLSIDSNLFSHMDDCVEDEAHKSPFVVALHRGFNKVIFKFWESAPNWHTFNKRVLACALAYAPNSSDEIFRLVLGQNRQIIEDTYFYRIWSPLKGWAFIGKSYPFECVLKEEVGAADLRRCIVEMIFEENPLRYVAQSECDEDRGVQIATILVDACEKEIEQPNGVKLEQPWFARDRYGETVLHDAIQNRREKVALHFLSLKKVELLLAAGDPFLFLAISCKCHDVAQKILDLVDQYGLKTLLTFSTGRTILHDAPRCKGDFVKQAVKRYPELLRQTDDDGVTVLHSWMRIGELWAFQCILNKDEFSTDIRRDFVELLNATTDDEGKNPLHVAAESSADAGTDRIVQFLFDAIRKQDLGGRYIWAVVEQRDSKGNTPVDIALSNRSEKLALCLLSELSELDCLSYLFKAVDKKCHLVVKFLLDKIDGYMTVDILHKEGKNVLHIASKCTEENAKLIVEKRPELIHEKDEGGKTPLERALEAKTNWLCKLILQQERSSILKAPMAWVEPCEKGDLSTILAFAENTYFRYICRKHKDTPLHHVKFKDYEEYQRLLRFEPIQELKNVRDSQGDTPLHKAIKNGNRDLTEILVNMADVEWNIKNKDGKTAMDLLEEEAYKDPEWDEFCKALGVDPRLKITYIQSKKDVTKMREIISLVAALLATITFTAGFTLPGGFNSESGEAVLAKKAAFFVFLIADTYAMCCSMLILFSIIWSMVCGPEKSSFLADRSLELLKQALYGTFLAFMTGVYTVTYKKSLWMAIMVIIMCSLTVILAQRRILHKMFEIMNSVTQKARRMQRQLPSSWEQWASYVKSWGKHGPLASNNQGQDEEAAPLTNQSEHQEITTSANNQSEHQNKGTLGEPSESGLDSIV